MNVELKVGAATVTRVEESYEPNFDIRRFFPDITPGMLAPHRAALAPNHLDAATDFLKLSIHSWLLRIGGKTILIDACAGNHKSRPTRPQWHMMETRYLERMAEAGVRPEQVDMVMCTHLHLDHVGWNTRLENGRWVPTFPNARYVFSRADYEYFTRVDNDPEEGPANHGSYRDSVLPIVEAGLAQMVDGTHAIDEYLTIDPAPGHTPGTVAIRLDAGAGGKAMFSGDILHHVLQIHYPQINSFVCADAETARASRRMVLEHCCGTGALLMPAHFGAPFVCHVDNEGEDRSERRFERRGTSIR